MSRPILLFLATLLCTMSSECIAVASAEGYFCTREGTKLKYERRSPGGNKLWWIHTESIDSVNPGPDGSTEAVCTISIVGVEEKSILKKPVTSKALIHTDGTVELNVATAAEEAAKQRFSAVNFVSTGGTSLLPASLQPGAKLEDVAASVSWAGIKYILKVSERSVLRTERITVPAGTFDCIVVKEKKLEKAPLYKRERITYTWYAPGVGMVRHDTYFTSGVQECSETLVSID
ncbi:MAG: hypothetical protein IKH11_00765 [Bacteroidales bacterium]|nr:hypothetical protein [Bacteroidales bacterium]